MADMVLGHAVSFEIAELPSEATDKTVLRAMFETMLANINDAENLWSSEQADTFRLIDRLVVFRENRYKGKRMTRSYMAQQERTFFWVDTEYVDWEPQPRRATAYFHDAWHVRQFIDKGHPPNDEEVLIDREQDAMRRQLEVAQILCCDSTLIDDLTDYSRNRERIRSRLTQGVGFAAMVKPHFLVLE